MKNLCTKKKYDLSQLNIDQLTRLTNEVVKEKCANIFRSNIYSILGNEEVMMIYREGWILPKKGNETELTNAIELFEEETHLLSAQDFVSASKSLAQIGIGLKQISENLNTVSKIIHDKNCLDSDIKALIEKGKQHGLKIVVTFEKL